MVIIKSVDGNNLIKEKILFSKPFIATKMGSVEQNIIISKLNNNYDLIKGIRYMASNNAGITPNDDNTLDFFVYEYIKSLENVDMIGFMGMPLEDKLIERYTPNAICSELRFLEPFYFDNPWSEALEGLDVLVIHPFEETIQKQYAIREKLFSNKKVLPEFNLLTIKAEQTNGGGISNSKPFIESLNIMKSKIDNIDFDIALIGCGAYGLLLADYIKNKGKQSIHIGGGLQILFGIKGKRWDSHSEIGAMYNENWCRPLDSEKPVNYIVVEDGTYW